MLRRLASTQSAGGVTSIASKTDGAYFPCLSNFKYPSNSHLILGAKTEKPALPCIMLYGSSIQ